MKDWFTHFFAPSAGLPAGGQEWRLGSDGLSSGWAFFLFLLLAAATVWAYRRFAPGVGPWRRRLLIALRLAVIALFLVLLARPVINITINEPIRQNLVLLFDTSKSMAFRDQRDRPDDLKRAALAAGLLDPAKGLKQELPAGAATKLVNASRWDLLQQLTANPRLNLLPRLAQKSDLTLYKFGRDATAAGAIAPEAGTTDLTMAEAGHALAPLHPDQPATAVGEALREVLQETRGQPTAGIVLVTDGGSNSGLPPVEAAQMARDAKVPLFVYGVGITTPPDLILSEVGAPKIAFVQERVEVTAKLRGQGLPGHSVTVSLKANGKEVDSQKVDLGAKDGDHDISFHFVPPEKGELVLEASTPVLSEEIGKDNNVASTKLRVVDSKVHVLLIEQQPRWDFRYLLAYLQGDRRLDVHAVVIDAEPGLDKLPNSPFLASLPDNKEAIFNSEVVILGDVNPAALGDTRMKLLRDWVEGAGGGIIFLAGPQFDPVAYANTPLAALLPIVPAGGVTPEQFAERSIQPVPLKLTPLGENSPYLQMAPTPVDNARVWNSFTGVRWTARVSRAKPGARVLLVDPRPGRTDGGGALPVFAIQEYGAGTCVYIGTDETYRWRSHVGGQYYSTFWGQIMESLSLQRLQDASSLIRLKTDKQQYLVGDKVVIAGKVYNPDYTPVVVQTLRGSVVVHAAPSATGVRTPDKTLPLDLSAVPDEAGGYRGELIARTPGDYQFSTLADPTAVLKFQIVEPNLEAAQTALDEPLLRAVADAAHGKFLREEDLDKLPGMLAEKSETAAIYKKIELYHSPWWIVALLFFAATEWLLRRLMQLK